MLTALTLALALGAAPTPQGQSGKPEAAPPPQGRGTSWGCSHPKWIARKAINRHLGQIAGFELYERLWKSVDWLNEQGKADAPLESAQGREVGTTAILALSMLGTGANPQTGLGKPALLAATAALTGRQDQESGAIGERSQPEFLLDHALALAALAENYFSLQVPELEAAPRLAVKALLDARGEDGLWHADGVADAPVDPLVTALAGYALFGARAANLEVPDEAFERVLEWSVSVAERAKGDPDPALERDEALDFAGALVARVFAAGSLKRSLAGDAASRDLSRAVAALVPAPPGVDAEWKAPERLAEPDFAFLATLGLFQSDPEAAGRCSRWLAPMFLADAQKEGEAAGSFEPGETGRLPGGRVGTTALRLLAMQNAVRELSLGVFAQ